MLKVEKQQYFISSLMLHLDIRLEFVNSDFLEQSLQQTFPTLDS